MAKPVEKNQSLILGGRATEKATAGQAASRTSGPVYTLIVRPVANKVEVGRLIEKEYKVKPLKIRMVNLPSGLKKALVYLKPGETLNLK